MENLDVRPSADSVVVATSQRANSFSRPSIDNITAHPSSGDLFVAEDGGNLEPCTIAWVGGVRQVAPFLRISAQSGSEITGPFRLDSSLPSTTTTIPAATTTTSTLAPPSMRLW